MLYKRVGKTHRKSYNFYCEDYGNEFVTLRNKGRKYCSHNCYTLYIRLALAFA